METFRRHGEAPYRVVVVHGGPGAAGEMAPVAEELASDWGVLEPFQTAGSVEGQVEELKLLLATHGNPPVTLVGFSWGAWLSYLLTAVEPKLVEKLILVGSAPFEESYAAQIQATRLRRMSDEERAEYDALILALDDPNRTTRNAALARIGALTSNAEAYKATPAPSGTIDFQADLLLGVWAEAEALRSSGKLLAYGQEIQCPVVALHGDYDPHPAEGVEGPLSRVVSDFRFVLLKHCGHKPWIEKQARSTFFRKLSEEIGPSGTGP